MGATAYLDMLRLEMVHRYDAQGNHFDRGVLTQRLYGALDAWMARALPASGAYPTVRVIEQGYQELRGGLAAHPQP
eukprot:1967933-Lingulodinium_polyedra.AAC.1